MFVWSLTHKQSVFKRYHISQRFAYNMAAKNQLAYIWNKITSLLPYVLSLFLYAGLSQNSCISSVSLSRINYYVHSLCFLCLAKATLASLRMLKCRIRNKGPRLLCSSRCTLIFTVPKQLLCPASYVSWQRGAACICCCVPCCGAAVASRRQCSSRSIHRVTVT